MGSSPSPLLSLSVFHQCVGERRRCCHFFLPPSFSDPLFSHFPFSFVFKTEIKLYLFTCSVNQWWQLGGHIVGRGGARGTRTGPWEAHRVSFKQGWRFSLRNHTRSFVFCTLFPVPGVCLLHSLQHQLFLNVYVSLYLAGKTTIADLKLHGCCEMFAFQACFGHFVRFVRVSLRVITQRGATFRPGCAGSFTKGRTDGAHEFLRYCRTKNIIHLGAIRFASRCCRSGCKLFQHQEYIPQILVA